MKKKQAFVALGGMVLLSIGYYSGVYFTGNAFDKELVKLEQDTKNFLMQKGLAEDLDVSFKIDDSNFHFRHFNVVLKNPNGSEELIFPMSATIGFLSTNIEANKVDDKTKELLQFILNESVKDINLDRADVETKIHVSALPREIEFASRMAHTNGKRDFHVGVKGSLDEKENGSFDFIIKNYKDRYLTLEEVQLTQNTNTIAKGSSLGDMSLLAKSIASTKVGSKFDASNLVFKITSSKVAEDGTFVINMDLNADSISGSKNIKSNIDVLGFDLDFIEKVKKLQEYNSQSQRNAEFDQIIKMLMDKLIKFDVKNISLDANLALFAGDRKEFTDNLKNKFNYKEDTVPLNIVGNMALKPSPLFFLDPTTSVDLNITTSKEAAPVLNNVLGQESFKEDNNKYKTHIVFKNGSLQAK